MPKIRKVDRSKTVSSKEHQGKKMAKKILKSTSTPPSPLDAVALSIRSELEDDKKIFRKFAKDSAKILRTEIDKYYKKSVTQDLIEATYSNFANVEKAFKIIENKQKQLFQNFENDVEEMHQAVLHTKRSIKNLMGNNPKSIFEHISSQSEFFSIKEVMKNVETASKKILEDNE